MEESKNKENNNLITPEEDFYNFEYMFEESKNKGIRLRDNPRFVDAVTDLLEEFHSDNVINTSLNEHLTDKIQTQEEIIKEIYKSNVKRNIENPNTYNKLYNLPLDKIPKFFFAGILDDEDELKYLQLRRDTAELQKLQVQENEYKK